MRSFRLLPWIFLLIIGAAQATYNVFPGSKLHKSCYFNYLSGIAISACTHTHKDYRASMDFFKSYFTADGWQEYTTYLNTIEYGFNIKQKRYSVLCSVVKPPKILSQEVKKKIHRSYEFTEVAIPVRVTYLKAKQKAKVVDEEYFLTMIRPIKSNRYGKVDRMVVRDLVTQASKKKTTIIDYDTKPAPICDIEVKADLRKPLHSDLEIRLWVDEALQNVYHADQGKRFFSDAAWQSFLLMHKTFGKKITGTLQGQFAYDTGLMPTLIKSRGFDLEERVYKWQAIKWFMLENDGKKIDMRVAFTLSRVEPGQGIRGIQITDIHIADKRDENDE